MGLARVKKASALAPMLEPSRTALLIIDIQSDFAGPDGMVFPDTGNELPGRGAWVTAERKAIEKAASKGQLAKVLEAKVPPGLTDLVETLLLKRAQGMLGFAKKAGLIVTGFERVKETLDKHEVGLARIAVLIEASDGALDGRRSVVAKARAIEIDAPLCGMFTSDELSMALGAANVIHACLLSAGPGGLHARFLEEIGRTAGFRAMTPAAWAGTAVRRTAALLPGRAEARTLSNDAVVWPWKNCQ